MNESELLFSELLKCDRLSLYLNRERTLGKNVGVLVSSVLKKRISGEPLDYILGKTEFRGLEFKVNPDVFIPRPETEMLVEKTLECAYRLSHPACRQAGTAYRILELGTGSGCTIISLAKELRRFHFTATDISLPALNIAQENAIIHNVNDKITFLKSDLFKSLSKANARYALCVANPPYIPSADIENLDLEVQQEPRIALDGGKDGLDFYRRIITEAPFYLEENGLLIMEMGFNQKNEILGIFNQNKNFAIVKIVKDYNHLERVIVARLKN